MMKVIPTDVYDKEGNLIRLDFFDLEGEFQFQAEWDDRDEQTSENRSEFRKWAYQMAKRLDFEVLE
jgi:hypothetical protein